MILIDNNLHYCCEDFADRAKMTRNFGPNIRITKSPFTPNAPKPYRFFIAPPFEIGERIAVFNIMYCPNCGICLRDFYKSDEYINEVNTFPFWE